MLIGQYKSRLGVKKRVALPKKFRDELGDEIIITRGYEGCLVVVDIKRWERITREVTGGTFIDKKIRDSGRFLLAGAHEIELDAQGRFVVPSGLLEYADFEDEVVFLGLVNWVELWSTERWGAHEGYVRENSDDIAQEIAEIVKGND